MSPKGPHAQYTYGYWAVHIPTSPLPTAAFRKLTQRCRRRRFSILPEVGASHLRMPSSSFRTLARQVAVYLRCRSRFSSGVMTAGFLSLGAKGPLAWRLDQAR